MSKKQPTVGRALLPLIIIPITAIIDVGLIVAGVAIDNAMYNPPPDTPGFPFPAITIIFMLIGAVISIIAFIVMIVLIIVGLVKVKKAKEELEGIRERDEGELV